MDVVWAPQVSHWRDGGLLSPQPPGTAVTSVSECNTKAELDSSSHTALALILGPLDLISNTTGSWS